MGVATALMARDNDALRPMRPSPCRPSALSSLRASVPLLMVLLVSTNSAQAEPGQARGSVLVDLGASLNGPLGPASIAVAYATTKRWAFGLGIGFIDEEVMQGNRRAFALFARAPLYNYGLFNLGVGATLSRRGNETSQSHTGPNVQPSWQTWFWDPGYRADLSLVVELAGDWWSLRLEPGLGYYLNAPQCTWTNQATYFSGSCDSSEIPAAYHSTISPGQVAPSLAVAAGLRFGGDSGTPPPPTTDWGSKTWAAALVAGDLGGIVGALALGGAFWALFSQDCKNASSLEDDPFCGVFETIGGGVIGGLLGLTTGVYLVGRNSIRPNGGWGWTFLGVLAGAAAAGLGAWTIYALAPGDRTTTTFYGGLALAAVLPAVSAAIFYRRSATAAPPAPALVDYSRTAGLTPSVPLPSIASSNGHTSVGVGLIGGHF